MTAFVIRADCFHTPERGQLEYLPDTLIEVAADGVITAVGLATPERVARAGEALVTLAPGQCLLPGLVDLHVHAPQWPQIGKALDVPLEDWLQKHTFPLEARYADVGFARAVYAELVETLLAHGTTTAVYFATIHVEATVALAETCLAKGQRALVGKVAMDAVDECPDYYRDADPEAAIAGTRAVIARIQALQPESDADRAPLVHPVITPRFLPSCSEALLEGLGELARETGLHVQTHISESEWEVAHGQARFGQTDAEALDGFGLLTDHGVLAHGNFVTQDDCALIDARGAALAHCPLSNVYFAGEVLPARRLIEQGSRIGLGTDISAGHTPSLLESARLAVTMSRVLERSQPGSAIGVADAFWMATAGGGEALGLPIGRFVPGCEFDAIAVDTAGTPPLARAGEDTPEAVFEKIVRRAGEADIARVWVRGRVVKAR